MKKFFALLTNEKQPRMNEKMLALAFFELYTVYIKKLGQFFFHTLYPPLTSYIYFNKLIRKIHITHHHTPNSIYACILPHAH